MLFAHGCFWHGHDCLLFKWPRNRADFWRTKLNKNKANDQRSEGRLRDAGWRVGVVWECALKGPGRLAPEIVLTRCARWLEADEAYLEIRGAK